MRTPFETETRMDIKAVFFDTGGTVLDWHGGIVKALAGSGRRKGSRRTGMRSPTTGAGAR